MPGNATTEFIRENLPAPPCRLLQISRTPETHPALQNYQAGVTHATTQDIQSLVQNIETREKFAAVLLCACLAEHDPLLLFNCAHDLLGTEGILLIDDLFSFTRTPHQDYISPPLQQHVINQAQRCGFVLQGQITSSSPDSHHNATAVLKLMRAPAPRWRISTVGEADCAAVSALFREVFKEPMDETFWRWKYAEGRSVAILARRDTEAVAHYGGMLRRLRCFGEDKQGVQIGDVMVSDKERGVLTRKGAFFLAAATFPERYVGYGSRIYIGFGFPNARAMKVAERLGLYGEVGRMAEIRWQALHQRARLMSTVRIFDPLENPQGKLWIEKLWREMAADLSKHLVCVRDWEYIRHRYCRHPHKTYLFVIVRQRFSGKPLGISILRRDGDACVLLDYLGPLRHCALTLRQTRRMLVPLGIKRMSAWISENFCDPFSASGGTRHTLDVRIPTSVWTAGPAVEALRGHWWLTSGDTDFN